VSRRISPFGLPLSGVALGAAFALLSLARGATPPSPAEGESVFNGKPCAACHGIGGKGGSVGPRLDDIGARHDPDWIRKKIVTPAFNAPNTSMPAVALKAQELDALVAYLAAQKGTKGAAPAPSSSSPAAPRAPAPPHFVGSAACLVCHAGISKEFRRTIHSEALMLAHDSKTRSGCESCHGPGSRHAETGDPKLIVQPAKLKPRDNAQLCLRCHAPRITPHDWMTSAHSQAGLSCSSCHQVMRRQVSKLLIKPEEQLCESCHRKEAAQFKGVSHHPVPEGRMKCVDCHDPHSGVNDGMLRLPANELCLTCHSDKRGPFVFEHPAVNGGFTEGCLSCHMPHGSPFDRLKKISGRGLCLQCHTDKAVRHFDTYPDCSSAGCHTQIHGSHEDQLFLR
jgi:DmsE family decaheme c-type cytochrome